MEFDEDKMSIDLYFDFEKTVQSFFYTFFKPFFYKVKMKKIRNCSPDKDDILLKG